MRSIRHAAIAAVALLCASASNAAVISYAEVEPNNSRATAQLLDYPSTPNTGLKAGEVYDLRVVGNLTDETGYADWFRVAIPDPIGFFRTDVSIQIDGIAGAAAPIFQIFNDRNQELFGNRLSFNLGRLQYIDIGLQRTDANASPYLLNILITAVPEPTTWALMLAGFAMTGYALRRRRASIAFA